MVRGRHYRALMVAAGIGLFLLAPVVGLAVAVGVVVAKGGGGDLYVLRATTGAGHLRTRTQRLLAAAARGGAGIGSNRLQC